jgi:hypothetical protein
MPTDVDEKPESSCQKLLFSATLARDPGKIALLDLRDPKYFLVHSSSREGADGIMDAAMAKYSLPAGLKVFFFPSSQRVHFLTFARERQGAHDHMRTLPKAAHANASHS